MVSNITDWFEYPTNYSNGTSVDGLGTFVQWANSTIGNSMGLGIILVIFSMSFGGALISGTKKALMVSGFITSILSIYLWRLGMINPVVIITLIIITIVGAIGSYNEGGGSP